MTTPTKKDTISPRTTNLSPVGKCNKCNKRPATKGCILIRCLGCCDDKTCERHERTRENARQKEQILTGTTSVQLLAKTIRGKLLKPGRFRETGFIYQGDTVVIWHTREYFANAKWREESVRKSKKRNARLMDSFEGFPKDPLRISRRRFRRIVEQRYRASLKKK